MSWGAPEASELSDSAEPVLAYTPTMHVKRMLACLIVLPLLASTTWGIGCDLRCSLGGASSCGTKATFTSAERSAAAPRLNAVNSATHSEHCRHMAQMTQIEETQPAAQTAWKHANAAAPRPQQLCDRNLPLVLQSKSEPIQRPALRVFSAGLSSNTADIVQAAFERLEIVNSPPRLFRLRI
jgi:hypothetical protein